MTSVKQPAAWKSSSMSRCRPGTFLSVNLTAWSTWSPSSRCVFAASRVGHWMVTSCSNCVAPSASPMKHGATLLAQLAGNHARRADTPQPSKIDLCVGSWVRLIGDNYFDRATWSAVSIDGCTFRGCSNQLRQYRSKPVRGVEEAFCFRGGQCLRAPHQRA